MTIKDTYYVVDFHHIDDKRCLRPLNEAVDTTDINPNLTPEELSIEERILNAELTILFSESGWEGDGEINCIFIPPCFHSSDSGATHCKVVYHVKQGNNGTSWLAIPRGMRLSLPAGFLTASNSILKK
jgi:hypothetical protein